MDYRIRTPQAGLSGKGTLDGMPEQVREKFLQENPGFVNEKDEELGFYSSAD